MPRPATGRGAQGTVILPFGRYFAGRADLLTRDGFKTVVPIDGVSPFSGVGTPDPELQRYADSARVNDRVRTEVRKDLAARLSQAEADYLVVDNSTALMSHREVDGRLYTLFPGEATELMDVLWNDDPAAGRSRAVKLAPSGFTDDLRSRYDSFVRACRTSFDATRIILVRSHAARFWVAEDGSIAPTNVDRRDPAFLDALDGYFAEQTGCRVAAGALGHFPTAIAWQTFDHGLRRAIEDDLAALCRPDVADLPPGPTGTAAAAGERTPGMSAADHVVGAVRKNRPVDRDWLQEYFAAGGASFDDLLALAYLQQRDPAGMSGLVRTCVRHAVADPDSHPQAVTRRRFDRSVQALRRWPWSPLSGLRGWRSGSLQRSLRGWRWGSLPPGPGARRAGPAGPGRLGALQGWWRGTLRAPADGLWTPQIAVPCRNVVFHFASDGSLGRVPLSPVAVAEADAVIEGRLPVTPRNLSAALGSWAVYLERGRRRLTAAPRVVVSDAGELVDSCAWIDWAQVLDDERVVITTAHPASVPARGPAARTDLSFLFDPNTRVGTVGGGLMDQVTHIALYDELCSPHGLDYYLDDLRYIWWRSHNGFEASRLAPDLERRRITRRVSAALIESFRDEVMKTRYPWVFNQSRVWHEFGLREATVVTGDQPDSLRLVEIGPDFPVRVYTEREELAELIRKPPGPLGFYTTLERMRPEPESADAVGRVFSFRHLESVGLDPDVARVADLLRSRPYVAFHVRRGDFLHPHFDTEGWHSFQSHYAEAISYLITSELGTSDFDVAVFSDDLDFVEAHVEDYGLDRVTGEVRFIRGHHHFRSIYDAYLMSLCPVVVSSVGSFAATTSLLADPPSVFIRARPDGVRVEWRR